MSHCQLFYPAKVSVKRHANSSNGLSKVHECDRRQTTNVYRQIDRATEKWVAIGKIGCARAILPKNKKTEKKQKTAAPQQQTNELAVGDPINEVNARDVEYMVQILVREVRLVWVQMIWTSP